MANPHRGEVDICLAGRIYTLRPTLHILAGLEERSGQTLPALAHIVIERGLPIGVVLELLRIATQHDGSPQLYPERLLETPLQQGELRALGEALAQFLMGALHIPAARASLAPTAATALTKPALDWQALIALGLGRLRLAPDIFWQMTLREFHLFFHRPELQPSAPLQRYELLQLMERFPDTIP